jgi:hypothetical protein
MGKCQSTARFAAGSVAALLVAGAGWPSAWAREVPRDLPAAPLRQAQEYAAGVPKTIVELQQFRDTHSLEVDGPDGKRGEATLVDLSPVVNAWYLLTLSWSDGTKRSYHLENAAPDAQDLALDPAYRAGPVIQSRGKRYPCDLWSSAALDDAAAKKIPYVPLCGGRIYLRNPVKGHRTDLEAVVDFLRDRVWGGEEIVGLVKDTVFKDAELEKAKVSDAAGPPTDATHGPRPARVDPTLADGLIGTGSLGIAVDTSHPGQMGIGRWYPARDLAGAYVSLIEPQAVAPEILQSYRKRVNALDRVEASALVYLVAFDLLRFDLAFALGTEHPRVDWSPRPPAQVRVASLPGPDGIGTAKPLVTTGMVTPRDTARTIATFTGGFKRSHGAFKYGDLALTNHGSHYGFIEEGVVFSKLQPGLATLYVLEDRSIRMKTWSESDNRSLAEVRYARQNGVPLVEWDDSAGGPVPGALVNRWGPGNWSGSANEDLRTVRAGVCLQETPGARFLIYAYFSSATPSAMARVFQAYDCHYGMLLDMNAPVHTYLALYAHKGSKNAIQNLVQGMSEADETLRGRTIPRFLGFPDNRDFFYLTRREGRGDHP